MKLFSLIFISALSICAKAQDWEESDNITGKELGMRMGTGVYSIFGGELQNPRPKVGFQAGMYLYGKKNEKRLNWQTGLEASFHGANFRNRDSFGKISASHYTQMGLIQLDIPLILNIRIAPVTETRYDAVQLGLLPGYIIRSILYLGPEKVPMQELNLKRWPNLPLHPVNLHATIGYQHIGGQSGFSIRARASIIDMNMKFEVPGILPATGNGRRIGSGGIEFALLF